MTVQGIQLYPTSDIHLLLKGPDGDKTPYQLHVRDYLKTTTPLSGITDNTKYTDHDTNIATVSATGLITPFKVGETICRIRHTDSETGPEAKTFVSEILARIRVHDQMDDIWIGNNRATLFKGEKSYVLTVYGHFTDGTIGDISSHPYLTFTSADTAKVRVDNDGDKGRLEGRNSTGNTAVKVKVQYKTISREVNVFVGQSIATQRRILKRIHPKRNVSKPRNILLLAEGFTAAEESLFMRMATLIMDRFFDSSLHEPFNLLKNSFNFWVAFDASGEGGLGCGSPVTESGTPTAYPSGQTTGHEYLLMQTKDSRLGFIHGPRYGDRSSQPVFDPSATSRSVMEWYLPPYPSHFLMWDRRRLPKDWKSPGYLQRYLGSLRLANGNRGPIDRWISGDDKGLVGFLIRSARFGLTGSSIGVRVSAHVETRYKELKVNGRIADHDLLELIPLKSLPDVAGTSISLLTASFAHEFGHAFDLGDEYEGQSYAHTHDVLKDTDKRTREKIDKSLNLTHHFRIKKAPTGLPTGLGTIDVKKVNWHRWLRVERAAVLIADPTVLSGDRLQIKIRRAERIKWIYAETDNRDVFLRSRNINGDNPSNQVFLNDGPLKIQSLQENGTMVLSGVTLAGFKKEDVLYLPQLDGAQMLTVFHPAVLKRLETIGEPFAKKADASVANETPSEPTGVTDPKFKPRIAALTIGVYEGGGTYNSKVYRPAGMCKMRDHRRAAFSEKPLVLTPAEEFDIFELNVATVGPARQVKRFLPFCYVCKYALANEIDPTKLEKIAYPP